jgi:hypothetical protein
MDMPGSLFRKPIIVLVICQVFALSLYGCGAKKAYVSVDRYNPTGISPGDSVVVLLNESIEYGVRIESERKERSVERCLRNSFAEENIQWKTMSANDFRKKMFPESKYDETPHTVERLLVLLQDERSRHQVEMLGIRYLIVVDTNTFNFDEQLDFAAEQSIWALHQSWTRSSSLTAYVIDVRQSAKSGKFFSMSSGKAGFVLPFLVIIPLPPIPLFALTEGEACSALGSAVASFLEGEQRPSMEQKNND